MISEDLEPDDALMHRVATGDARAARMLAQRHLDAVYGFALRLSGNGFDAWDLTQEAFLRLWTFAPRWKAGRARASTWLYAVVRNLHVDGIRRRAREAPEDAAAQIPAGPTPEERLAGAQTGAIVQRALAALPERQRTALILVYFEGLSYAEGARIMRTSPRAFEGLLARGRRALSDQLGESREAILWEVSHELEG